MTALQTWLPWTKSPLIVMAPMGIIPSGELAANVTIAGGVGFIGAYYDMDELRSQLEIASQTLKSQSLPLPEPDILPVGVGLLPFAMKIETILPILEEFKPVVVWLFASKEFDDYAEWAQRIRNVTPKSKIWIQVGSVTAAVQVARTAQPDAICLQGADAGGHGFERGAGIISLFPEAADTLKREGFGQIPLFAAGGIADGRGVAAALALGADGVVLGTRFLAAKEAVIHPNYRDAVLEAQDGGQATVRSKLFDELHGPNIWPKVYDGRSILMKSYTDWQNGVSIEEIRKLHNEELKDETKGFNVGGKGRAAIWAGTSVGLVKEVQSAAKIVQDVRQEARDVLSSLSRF